MTAPRDPDVLIREFLGEGQTELPDRAFETVRTEIHHTRQRAVIGPWRQPDMPTIARVAIAAAAVVAVVLAWGYLRPTDSQVGGPAVSPSPVVSPSATPGPTDQSARLTVAGTGGAGNPLLQLTATLPESWTAGGFYAERGPVPGPGIAFFASVVDNTFTDPCTEIETTPKVGPTVEDLATALGKIPGTTATDPVQTRIAGLEATYLEVQLPASLPCTPSQFVLWQDSPGNDWYALGPDELFRIWIVTVGDQRVVVAGRSYPDTSVDRRTELQGILDSIEFDVGSTSPSGSPAAS